MAFSEPAVGKHRHNECRFSIKQLNTEVNVVTDVLVSCARGFLKGENSLVGGTHKS